MPSNNSPTHYMPEHGSPQNAILNELETKLQNDLIYTSDKILSSMCTSPHSFAKQVYQKYMEKNLGHTPAEFDFNLSGVSSITVDPHKMGLAPVHVGGILFRDSKLTEA